MPRVLSARALDLLEDFPPFMQGSKDIQAAVDAMAREVDRLDSARAEVSDNFFPQTGDGMLDRWESLLGLSVNPPDKTLDQRRTSVLAFMQKIRGDGSGLDWQDNLTALIGNGWTYSEHIEAGLLPTNLITNPKAATDTSGWSIQGSGGETLTRITSGLPTGFSTGFSGTVGGANNTRYHFTAGLPVVAGDVVRFAGWLRNSTTTAEVALRIARPGFSAIISHDLNPAVAGQWVWVDVTYTAITTETLQIYAHGAGGVPQFTGMILTKNGDSLASSTSYFDGDTSGYAWSGTANASSSHLVNTVPAWTVRVQLPFAAPLGAPTTLAATPGTGGTPGLSAGTYHYKVTATNFYGETTPSADVTATVVAGGKATLSWDAKTGATGYTIYRGTTSSNHTKIATVTTNAYVDQGGQTATVQAPPTVDTTETFQAFEAKALARAITPAHLELDFGLSGGFLVGISQLGDTL